LRPEPEEDPIEAFGVKPGTTRGTAECPAEGAVGSVCWRGARDDGGDDDGDVWIWAEASVTLPADQESCGKNS